MLSQLFPALPGDSYKGGRAALWILGVVLALRFIAGCAAVFNGEVAAGAADGFPLAQYSSAGAQAVIALFGAIGVTQILVCVVGFILLARYRPLVPLFVLFLILEFLARKGVAYFHAVERAPGNFGLWINWVMFSALCVALLLSLRGHAE